MAIVQDRTPNGHGVGMVNLPKLSIAAKLYTIFALLAVATMALAGCAVFNSWRHAELTSEVEAVHEGTLNVERVNGLIYAVVMESRGIYMSSDFPTAKKYGVGLLRFNDRIGEVVDSWRKVVRDYDAEEFAAFAKRIKQFQEFRRELVRLGTEVAPEKGREWGDNDANRTVRTALNKDLETLAKLYDDRLQRLSGELEMGIRHTSWILSLLAVAALALAAVGIAIIWRAVARPLAEITRVTEAVARGIDDVTVPFGDRHDEVGALARSIGVFQEAMRRNEELNHTVASDAAERSRRQEHVAAEIERFGSEVEATVAELGRIAEQMVSASAHLVSAADQASSRTESAATLSGEASSNVRDIASAAEELSASVMEIDRQVSHSNSIAAKAVG